jgi:hypothetical protein
VLPKGDPRTICREEGCFELRCRPERAPLIELKAEQMPSVSDGGVGRQRAPWRRLVSSRTGKLDLGGKGDLSL